MRNFTAILRKTLAAVIVTLSVAGVANAQGNRNLPGEVVVTPYTTTMRANGVDEAQIKITAADWKGNTLPLNKQITFEITGGDAYISKLTDKQKYTEYSHERQGLTSGKMINGILWVTLTSGTHRGSIHFVAKTDSLYPGSTDIDLVQPAPPHKVTEAVYKPEKVNGKILGADISFLPELEARGVKFSDKGVQKDVIQILKDHGFNYIRLRIFNNPAADSGYSPRRGFCDLEHTKQMAKRVKAAGMKLLLDFHYSDTWADPGKQFKPHAWRGADFAALKDSVYNYTTMVLEALKAQGTSPDMVQVGNEINHGMIWPEGRISNLDSLAQLIYAGERAVKHVNKSTPVMLHIALGGQNQEARFFCDAMLSRNVPFDVIGLSYYPKWHGTLEDLKGNMTDLAERYKRQVMVAEYTYLKTEVNDIAFNLPDGRSLGTFIWEPLNTWEQFFERDGKTNQLIDLYDGIAKKHNIPPAK